MRKKTRKRERKLEERDEKLKRKKKKTRKKEEARVKKVLTVLSPCFTPTPFRSSISLPLSRGVPLFITGSSFILGVCEVSLFQSVRDVFSALVVPTHFSPSLFPCVKPPSLTSNTCEIDAGSSSCARIPRIICRDQNARSSASGRLGLGQLDKGRGLVFAGKKGVMQECVRMRDEGMRKGRNYGRKEVGKGGSGEREASIRESESAAISRREQKKVGKLGKLREMDEGNK